MKIVYDVDCLGLNYEVRCDLLSYRFMTYLATKQASTTDDIKALLQEVIDESHAEFFEPGNDTPVAWENMPNAVLMGWLTEMLHSSRAQTTVKVRQQKN